MNVKRTTTILVVGALVAWLAGAATSNRPIPSSSPVAPRPAVDKRGAELAGEIERLHERLAPSATPSAPSRNLFTFRAAPIRTQAPPAAAPVSRPALSEIVPPMPGMPPLKLAGIAEDAVADGADAPARVAFISGGGQLFMVKEGETVTPRYRVAKISGDVVELTDVIDNSIRRLALR